MSPDSPLQQFTAEYPPSGGSPISLRARVLVITWPAAAYHSVDLHTASRGADAATPSRDFRKYMVAGDGAGWPLDIPGSRPTIPLCDMKAK